MDFEFSSSNKYLVKRRDSRKQGSLHRYKKYLQRSNILQRNKKLNKSNSKNRFSLSIKKVSITPGMQGILIKSYFRYRMSKL